MAEHIFKRIFKYTVFMSCALCLFLDYFYLEGTTTKQQPKSNSHKESSHTNGKIFSIITNKTLGVSMATEANKGYVDLAEKTVNDTHMRTRNSFTNVGAVNNNDKASLLKDFFPEPYVQEIYQYKETLNQIESFYSKSGCIISLNSTLCDTSMSFAYGANKLRISPSTSIRLH